MFVETNRRREKSIAFYVVSSSKELLQKVDQLMLEKGLIGFKDPMGRYHYIVDGRKGAPYAVKRIDDMAKIILRERGRNIEAEEMNANFYVEAVLSCYKFDHSLKGYQFLKYMLVQLTLNPSLRQPLSKTLYPLVADAFNVTISQVERNVRYCLEKLKEKESEKNSKALLPLHFGERGPSLKPIKTRVLIEGAKSYSNADAIRVLESEIQKLIRLDKKKAVTHDSPSDKN